MSGYVFENFEITQSRFLGIEKLKVGYLIKVSCPYERNQRIYALILKVKVSLPQRDNDVSHGLITAYTAKGITYHSLTSAEIISKI
jgi:hypothetical protein